MPVSNVLPDRMASYATYELVELLLALTPQQRAAIDRIVQHVYIDNQPLTLLFRGPDRICAEQKYYQRGKLDEETGHWVRRPGWHHDKAFQDALTTAARLALQVRTKEELHSLQTAKRMARMAAPNVIESLALIAVMGDPKLAAAAGKVVLDYGSDDGPAATEQPGASEADDWWKAAGE